MNDLAANEVGGERCEGWHFPFGLVLETGRLLKKRYKLLKWKKNNINC